MISYGVAKLDDVSHARDGTTTIPHQAAESLRTGQRFNATTGSAQVLADLVWIAVQAGINLNEIAAFARTRAAFFHLREMAAKPWPELASWELFADELSGTPLDALRYHTALVGDITRLNYSDLLENYLTVLARINDIELPPDDYNRKFIRQMRRRIAAAIRADHEARLDPTLRWPDNGCLEMARDYVKKYKRDRRLLDLADLVHGPYRTSPQVKLLLLDGIDDAVCPLIVRLFPNASVVRSEIAVELMRQDAMA